MEEWVGELWHNMITRMADRRHPEAAVKLTDMRQTLGIFFRALGGDGGLQVEAADATLNPAHRSWMQRLAGANTKIHLAWRDQRSLRLPPKIAWFDSISLNRDLYFWLAALGACTDDDTVANTEWLDQNQRLTQHVLQRFPGLGPRYQRLVRHHLMQRPDPQSLNANQAEAERTVRQALTDPGSVSRTSLNTTEIQVVPLWLHPEPPQSAPVNMAREHSSTQQHSEDMRELEDVARRQAEHVDEPDDNRGLVTVRMENIFTMGEFVNVDRGSEEEDDIDRAENVARELDKLAISRNGKASKAKLKFDLDLPSAIEDDAVLDDGMLLPEWDWRKQTLQPNRCRVVVMRSEQATPCPLPLELSRTAKKLRSQFQALVPARTWLRAQSEGQDIDLDAYQRFFTDRKAGLCVSASNLYRDVRSGDRDLSCLLLADLSLSTDTWINDDHRIIDVIKDSLFLFAECLHATGDRFSLYGFSTRKRDPIRIHAIKDFDEAYGAEVRGRINVIRPGYYTRLGAGIRYATQALLKQGSGTRLLLVLTDGKPNDLDQYEGRYGIEDTRQAVIAARQLGLFPFCVTIDRKGNDYLPYLFGKSDYAVIRDPRQLPRELPRLYALLT
ncbi:MAG: VWA domain-containing protein [Gammaproteobacteria bacterium]|nr:VWA domain-containing protein [Gammaproteobacteria bacterium]